MFFLWLSKNQAKSIGKQGQNVHNTAIERKTDKKYSNKTGKKYIRSRKKIIGYLKKFEPIKIGSVLRNAGSFISNYADPHTFFLRTTQLLPHPDHA